ncbi:MAG TPA: peptide deformylase [Armatimonadota bacterium]|nr:peptide deformylase [Armatimonadota bacterium]
MSVLRVYDVNQPCLRAKCKKVNRITDTDRRLLDDMVETMRAANGVGLAASQVGVLQRMIVVELDEELYMLVNPEIVEGSDETDVREEGCLSLPYYYGPVVRSLRITVRALDPHGKRLKIRAEDWLARVLQHEIDHLDGILFFDPMRMRSLDDLVYKPPEAEGAEDEPSTSEQSDRKSQSQSQGNAEPVAAAR